MHDMHYLLLLIAQAHLNNALGNMRMIREERKIDADYQGESHSLNEHC